MSTVRVLPRQQLTIQKGKKLGGNNVWFIPHESESPLAQWGWEHAYMITNTLDDTLKMHDTARPEVSAQYARSIMQTCLKCVRTNALINAQTSKKKLRLQITWKGGNDVYISKANVYKKNVHALQKFPLLFKSLNDVADHWNPGYINIYERFKSNAQSTGATRKLHWRRVAYVHKSKISYHVCLCI